MSITVEYMREQCEEMLSHEAPPPIIASLMESLDKDQLENFLGSGLASMTEQFTHKIMEHHPEAHPMEAMAAAAGEAQVLLALLLLAVGMRFRDTEYAEADTADVNTFLNSLLSPDERDILGEER